MSVLSSRVSALAGVALLSSTSAFGQDDKADKVVTPSPTVAVSNVTDTNAIVVTGSRIARPDFAAPNPIVSFSAAAIQQSGNTNITNFLQRVPALTGSRDSTQTSGGNAVSSGTFGQAGLNELNLRNLGTNRTLVLVDGRRHVAGEASTAAVDINSIPTDLIERVDVLTGSASAVYGADGVTGVVNFILKRDFDGVAARSQLGVSRYGDGANRFVSVVAGHNFADGRGNVTLAYEYNADDPVGNDDRSYLRQNRRRFLIPNDADTPDNPSVPDNILVGNLHYTDISPNGAVFIGPEATPSFDGLGRRYDRGTPSSYYFTGGESTGVAGFFQGDLLPKTERHDVNLLAHYDVSDALKLSFDGKFAQTRARSFGQYTETFYVPISLDNPFVPAAIRAAALADDPAAQSVNVNRDNIDYGRQGEADLRRTYRGVVDASGRMSDHATWDAYYEYGRTTVRITTLNDRLADRYTQALDAVTDPTTGGVVCRSTLTTPGNGCVPISLFGPGPTSQAALGYFLTDDNSQARITQQVANASISGDFGQFFTLPGGPVQFALGGEYRRETSSFNPSANLLNAAYFQFDQPSVVRVSSGKFDVKEVFGELNVPIIKDRPFASTLSIGAAGRYSHYSTVGNTKTWQFNGVYAPVHDITLRGSYGKVVRAPNIGELFQPTTGTSAFFTDPCTPQQISNGTQFRASNCAATLAQVGATISPSLQTGAFVNGIQSGNANLKPESARTWTAGVVLRPRFMTGFTISFDWYNINLKNAINTVTPSDLANLCVDQQTIANPFCAAITRAQGTGVISGYTSGPQNVASFKTAGADLNLDYLIRTTRLGMIDLRFVGGYLNRLQFIGIPGAPVTDRRDLSGSPKFNFNFSPSWTLHGFTLNYNLRWLDATRSFDINTTNGNPDYATSKYLRASELWQHDVQLQYQLPSGFALYAGVTNLADQKPDYYSYSTNVPISPLGRFMYVGAKMNIGGKR